MQQIRECLEKCTVLSFEPFLTRERFSFNHFADWPLAKPRTCDYLSRYHDRHCPAGFQLPGLPDGGLVPLSSSFEERQLHRRESVNKADENAPAFPKLTSDIFGTNSEESSDRIRMHEDNDSSLSSDETASMLTSPTATPHSSPRGGRVPPCPWSTPWRSCASASCWTWPEGGSTRTSNRSPRRRPLEGRQLPGLRRRRLCRLELLGIQEQKSVKP
ncbi:CRF domain-containing protein [Caerostris extrusa]|uniref:CRF domain-containing protein n=1 Tax=Caerostris extrusa TaxID=172846 RepID=A0AAV4MPM5_CAEEX|nr:CRF domain-containing protein [Caerostris extrusa]